MSVSARLRFEIFERDGFRCQYCGSSGQDVVLEVDHVRPISRGGGDEPDNLLTACFDCNRGKSNRELPGSKGRIADALMYSDMEPRELTVYVLEVLRRGVCIGGEFCDKLLALEAEAREGAV